MAPKSVQHIIIIGLRFAADNTGLSSLKF